MKYIEELESEAIYILRETFSEFKNPILLFSGGKDSIVLSHLIKKVFYPAPINIPFVHIDTGLNFDETIVFRDNLFQELNVKNFVPKVEDYIKSKSIKENQRNLTFRNKLQSQVLVDFIIKNNIDAAIGGARRDEEKSRAKERIFSHRNEFSEWDSKNQRAELWNTFNTQINFGEHFRVFPLSNWTEKDIWEYIKFEQIKIPKKFIFPI